MTTSVPILPLFEKPTIALPTAAKQLQVEEISMREACRLNKLWHSLLPRTDLGNMLCGNMSVAYSAEFDERYYAVAIWSQPIVYANCDGHTIELRRLAICDDAPPNTATRFMAVMRRLINKKMPSMERAISYLAVDVHRGTIYRGGGWCPVGTIVEARPQRLRGNKQRATGPLQTKSRKQRWELSLGRTK